ncbi:outer membrane protein assembly factor BamB family protein [Marinoscillum furvescens]|uniref:Outer membrane protein assembly factor BamB n=1 Tax=Marinoscillum furvescens DSM 4134 TaxID=1122208 RepID=A0A3D9L175_MARFU|nr:PQQ-binding-like beta-propeller repeat protein [Marinoscillum furvescens]RED96568.1 outer membrane protein assembly factor BamB [Marinoscillum furvescens DSM 4134]
MNYYTSLAVLLLGLCLLSACSEDEPEKENELPVALFAAAPTAATVGDEIAFTDQSGDNDGEITSWAWDFGDGNTSAEQNPTHTYAEAGDYTVSLTVSDDKEATAHYSLEISVTSFKELWTAQIGTASISPSAPAVGADGTLYFGSQDFNVYAVNPEDGSVKWTFATGGKVRSHAAVGADGTIYVPAQDSKLYALTSSGSKSWEYPFEASIFNASPVIGSDGTIYQGADDNKLHAISSSGSNVWTFETGGKIRTDVALAKDGTIYLASQDGKLYALKADGTSKWTYDAGATLNASPILDDAGVVYFGDDAGVFHAVNTNGTAKWTFTTADNNPFLGGAVLGTDGTIYTGTKRGGLTSAAIFYAIGADGTEKWKHDFAPDSEEPSFQSDVLGTPTVGADGTIYVTFNDGNLYAFKEDGSIKFTYKVATDDPAERWDQAIWTSPALTDEGNIYFQDYSGNVYGLQVSASGLADSAWPTRGRNLKRSGL